MATTIEIEDVQRLNVQPGDVLLVTMPPGASAEECQRIRNAFETRLPVRAIVRTSDVQVEVLGPPRVR